ncbi:MAG: glycosyltransferase family 2 protein [Proteobacteria bacterium]|nr:glycosyltransferase family 2 protein [Pseudomonadota bacterium]
MSTRISVVLPMYDEAAMVDRVIEVVGKELDALEVSYELICVNDGSMDDTARLLDAAAGRDARVVPVHLSRNFGKEGALAAGLHVAAGEAVLVLDADLQHPPDLIPRMVEQWEDGFDVVEAVKADRGQESLPYRAAAGVFYSLMGEHTGRELAGSSDFKLLDRQVVDVITSLPEHARFFRGLVAWVGFRVAKVPFTVRDRAAGNTSWSPLGLARYAMRNVVSFSATPLRMVAWLGFVTLVFDGLLAVQTFWNWWSGVAVTGFSTVILAVVGLGGLHLLSLGVVAVYLAQMYEELKARPIYVIRQPREPRS